MVWGQGHSRAAGTPQGLRAHLAITVGILVLAALLPVAMLAVPDTAAAKKSKRGIDVSRFQGVIGWKRVGTTNNRFAYVAASRGSGSDCLVVPEECGPDPFYERNYRKARQVGIKVGPYHRGFVSGATVDAAKADARAEARVFAEAVGRLRGKDLVPAADVETPFTDVDDARLRVWIRVFLRKTEKKLNAKPIIYTNNNSWSATGDTTRFADDGYRLWVANFNVPSPLVPADNWGGRGWKLWQFTSTGRVRGVSGNVDRNKLDGSLRALKVKTYRKRDRQRR